MGKDIKSKSKTYKSSDRYSGIKRVPKRPEPLQKFNYGLKYDEYQNILYRINEFAQSEFAGEVGAELKTRKESKLHTNRILGGLMMLDMLGDRNNHAAMSQARWDRMQDDAQKRYSIKREDYYKKVKEFIGQVLKLYVHKDLVITLQGEAEFNELVNGESSAIRFMEWLENTMR